LKRRLLLPDCTTSHFKENIISWPCRKNLESNSTTPISSPATFNGRQY